MDDRKRIRLLKEKDVYTKSLISFLRKYAPAKVGTPEYREWVEDVRRIVVGSNLNFHLDVLNGSVMEALGFLESCVETFDTLEVKNGES